MPTLYCDECAKPFKEPPSKIKLWEHHFCNNDCRAAYFKGKPKGKRSKWVEVQCCWCDVPFMLTAYKAATSEQHFCSREHYWLHKTDWYSTYRNRDLEHSPRATVVHFLIMHSVPEHIVITAKSGLYTQDISQHDNPHELLIHTLFHAGFIALARLVHAGLFLNEDHWLCNGSEAWQETPILVLRDGIIMQAE